MSILVNEHVDHITLLIGAAVHHHRVPKHFNLKSCRLATQHWRVTLCGSSRNTSCCFGKKCPRFNGLNANETGRKNTRVTETFSAERDDVSVWELIGVNLVELSEVELSLVS